MPYTMEDFRREVRQQALKEANVEELFEKFKERFKELPSAEAEKYLEKLKDASSKPTND